MARFFDDDYPSTGNYKIFDTSYTTNTKLEKQEKVEEKPNIRTKNQDNLRKVHEEVRNRARKKLR